MRIQERHDRLENIGKKLYLFGVPVIILLLVSTFFLGQLFSALMMLQVRLAIVGTGIVYSLTVYFFLHRAFNKKHVVIEEKQNNEVLIYFNGKELDIS